MRKRERELHEESLCTIILYFFFSCRFAVVSTIVPRSQVDLAVPAEPATCFCWGRFRSAGRRPQSPRPVYGIICRVWHDILRFPRWGRGALNHGAPAAALFSVLEESVAIPSSSPRAPPPFSAKTLNNTGPRFCTKYLDSTALV